MKTHIQRILAPALAGLALLLAGVACGDESTPRDWTEVPATTTATREPNVMSTPNPTQVANIPAKKPESRPTNTVPEGAAPSVLWMTSDPGGTGLVIVRFETDVPVTASLVLNRGVPGDSAAPPNVPQKSDKLATRHTMSIPTGGPGDWALSLTITDNFGKQGFATFETGDVYGKQFWGRGANAPEMAMSYPKVTVSWVNLKGGPGKAADGQAVLLSKKRRCSVAESCVAEPIATFTKDTVGGDTVAETHKIEVTFPDDTHDYKVILVGRLTDTPAFVHFYQFDVTWKP